MIISFFVWLVGLGLYATLSLTYNKKRSEHYEY